jgi:hypothetical protein
MNTPRIAVTAAAAAVVAWAAKAVAIGLAGGLGRSSFENPLFFLGLLCALLSVGALAVSAAATPRWWARAGAVAGALVALFVVVALTSAALESVGDHWVWSELSLWVTSVAVLALAASRSSQTSSHHQTA